MRTKRQFERPAILRELALTGSGPILQGSVSDNTTIVSTGQEVKEYDFSGDNFNHTWE